METTIKTSAPSRIDGPAARRSAEVKKLISAGSYEQAQEVLGEFWNGIGNRPNLDGLTAAERAEVLLRVGALAGWIGSAAQEPGAQGFAKDMISESIRGFEELGDQEKTAEARSDLALCYWREGALDEARVWYREALEKTTDPANKLRILTRSAINESTSNRLSDALSLLNQAAPLLEQIDDDSTLGCYHMTRESVLRRMGGTENLDLALIESAAASFHFERANHQRFFARCENNTSIILRILGRHTEALDHLNRAWRTLTEVGDVGPAAQVNDTRARVFIDLQRYVEAEKLAFLSASALEGGDEQSLFAEALQTQGVALARMGRYQSALSTLQRAAQIAETAGNVELSGRVFLTILEELKSFLSPSDIGNTYQEADRRLGDNLREQTMGRLRACARLAIANTALGKTENRTPGATFEQEVHNRESELIKAALDEAKGSVTRAARLLGLTHQGLCYIINHRHKQLLGARAPIRVRRKSIIKKR